MNFNQFTKEQLGEAYKEVVGYNPFEDDKTISVEEVIELMEGYDETCAINKEGNTFKMYFSKLNPNNITSFTPNEDSYIASVDTVNTGGHIYNDVIVLKNGVIIRISEDLVGIYKDEEADEKGDFMAITEY